MQENEWFKDPTYIEVRLDWLDEAIGDISSLRLGEELNETEEELGKEISGKLEGVNERYLGVEDLVRRYGNWQVRTRKECEIVDWDEFGIKERGRYVKERLGDALCARERFLSSAEEKWGALGMGMEMGWLDVEAGRIEEGKKFFDDGEGCGGGGDMV